MTTKVIKTNNTVQKQDPNIPQEAYRDVSGVAGDVLPEKIAKFNKLKNEKVISNNDSTIVFGKDRNSSDLSGYGGKGEAKSHSIDMVVGRLSCVTADVEEPEKVWVNPDFKNDAARIHISQKTNIDKNFDLPDGTIGVSTGKSGIGIKADSIRVVARSGVKIISDIDPIDSRGLQDNEKVGIDLICGRPFDPLEPDANSSLGLQKHKDDMQPIPKGDNLVEALEDMVNQLDAISGVLAAFVDTQMEFNNYVAIHTHIENFYGLPGIPSKNLVGPNLQMNIEIFEKTIQDITNFKMRYLSYFRQTYLDPQSPKYINSRYHNLN